MRYDMVLPPSISIMWSPRRPVILGVVLHHLPGEIFRAIFSKF